MAAIQEYKCPCCGGAISFDSKEQKMKCPFCDTEFEMEALKAFDEELANEQPDEMNWDTQGKTQWDTEESKNMNVFVCKSCGGEIIADENTGATSCPYCDNPIVMMGQFAGDLKPDYVIPFKFDKKAAKEGLKKHLQGKKLLPKIFKNENHIDEVKGIYVPFWLFDAKADANIRYKATKVRSWSDNDYRYTETQHYLVARSGDIEFCKVPVDGSTKMPDDLMESIEPFDMNEAVDFQTAYLAGYLADKYDVTAQQSIDRANQRIKQSTEDAFRDTVNGYSTVMPEASSVHIAKGEIKYALYPVWILNTTWNGQKYMFAMNGQTGKFVGNLPIDKSILIKWFGGLTVGIGIVAYLIAQIVHILM